MDHKRDSRSQRVKNLQYKSRGRGRHPGPGHVLATVEAEGSTVGVYETDGGLKNSSGASDRLGSNWDRYVEPGEVDGAGTLDDGGVVEEVAKKQSEGLDYSLLLEEADALLSGGSIALLAHFDLDTEDLFQIHGVEEKPLPLNINLSVLNEGLSCLSMAERLGLEEGLLCLQEDEEDAPIDASEIDGANELGDEGTHLERKPTFSEPVTAPSKDNGVGTRREAVELTGPVAAALSSGPRGKAQVPSMGTSWLSEEAPGFKSRKDTSGEASGGARQPELSSSGQKQEEDADLLDVLLGRSSRAVTEGNGRIQGSGSARPAASEESLPERGEGGAVEQSRGKSVTRDLPPTGDALLRELSGGVGASFQEPMRGAGSHLPKDDSDRMELGGGGSVRTAFREADRTGSQTQQGEKASPAEDDIDALLAVLNPSASNTQAYVTADRAASNGGAMGGVRTAVTSAGSTSTAAPSNQLPESALLGSASSLSRGLASSSRTEQKVTAPISARSKPTVPADQDFDAWLDSIS